MTAQIEPAQDKYLNMQLNGNAFSSKVGMSYFYIFSDIEAWNYNYTIMRKCTVTVPIINWFYLPSSWLCHYDVEKACYTKLGEIYGRVCRMYSATWQKNVCFVTVKLLAVLAHTYDNNTL